MPIFVNVNMYVFSSCAAISGEFPKSSEMTAHNLNAYIAKMMKNHFCIYLCSNLTHCALTMFADARGAGVLGLPTSAINPQ